MNLQEAEEHFKKIEELLKIFKSEILSTIVAFKMEKDDPSSQKLVEDKKNLMKRLQFYWRHLPPLKTRWLSAKDRVVNLVSSIQICLAELSRKRQSFTHINDLVQMSRVAIEMENEYICRYPNNFVLKLRFVNTNFSILPKKEIANLSALFNDECIQAIYKVDNRGFKAKLKHLAPTEIVNKAFSMMQIFYKNSLETAKTTTTTIKGDIDKKFKQAMAEQSRILNEKYHLDLKTAKEKFNLKIDELKALVTKQKTDMIKLQEEKKPQLADSTLKAQIDLKDSLIETIKFELSSLRTKYQSQEQSILSLQTSVEKKNKMVEKINRKELRVIQKYQKKKLKYDSLKSQFLTLVKEYNTVKRNSKQLKIKQNKKEKSSKKKKKDKKRSMGDLPKALIPASSDEDEQALSSQEEDESDIELKLAIKQLSRDESGNSEIDFNHPLPTLKKAYTSPSNMEKTMDTLVMENKRFKEIIEKFEIEKKSQNYISENVLKISSKPGANLVFSTSLTPQNLDPLKTNKVLQTLQTSYIKLVDQLRHTMTLKMTSFEKKITKLEGKTHKLKSLVFE